MFDLVPSGIPGPVELIGTKGDETIVKNLSSYKWSYKVGLHGLHQKLYSSESPLASKWEEANLPINRMFTWYKVN